MQTNQDADESEHDHLEGETEDEALAEILKEMNDLDENDPAASEGTTGDVPQSAEVGGHVPDDSHLGASCGEGQNPGADNNMADGRQKETPYSM